MKYLILAAAAVVLLLACGSDKKAGEALPVATHDSLFTLSEAQIKNAGIETAKPEIKEISSILKVNGRVDVPPQNMVSISVPLGGYLKTTKLLPGMHVSKGEVIAVMEDQQYIQMQQDYLTAKAAIRYLENEYQRQKELNQSQASSDKIYEQAETAYRSQRILIASLAQKLQLAGINSENLSEANISRSINIYSPINGYVSKVNVNIGRYVSSTEVLFELINPLDIHLALKVFEKNLDRLFIGQPLTAYTNNNPGKKYSCQILLIGKDLSIEGNTDVHCHFEEYDKTLVPGTYMNAEIEVKNKNAIVLPEDAIVRYANKQYVFARKSINQFAMIEISAGNAERGFVEILSGERLVNEECVIKGAYSLLMSVKNKSEE